MVDSVIKQLLQIACAYKKRKRYGSAEQVLRQALELQAKSNCFDSGETATALFHLGDLYVITDKPLQAVPYFKMALRIWNELSEQEKPPAELITYAHSFLKDQAREIVNATMQGLRLNPQATFKPSGDAPNTQPSQPRT